MTSGARSVAAASGDAGRGKALFEGKGMCNTCHRVRGEGSRSGPDLSEAGLMLFMQLDHGAVVRKEKVTIHLGSSAFVMGNPLIMMEMVQHVPDAGSYAPVTVLVDERADGVHLSYDRMARLLAAYGNPDALQLAKHLDNKVETLLREAAA